MENSNQILVLRDNAKRVGKRLKREIINRDKKCFVCDFDVYILLEVHHKQAFASGGGNDKENLVALCPNCHAAAHKLNENKPLEYIGHCFSVLYNHYSTEQIFKLNSLCSL